MHIILAHENADFDAVASLLGAHKLFPDAIPILPEKQNRNVASFLALYLTGLPLRQRADIDAREVTQITLVDTQRVPQIKNLPADIPVYVIDHHPVKETPDARFTLTGEVIGSTTTLLVEQMQAQQITLSALEATLMLLGLYEDTGSLSYQGTTPRDIRAAAWLLEQQAALDTVRRFLEPPLNDEQQRLFETLLQQSETRVLQGYTVVVASAEVDTYISEISAIAHRLREILDPAALFVLVKMPTALHLVCRSTRDAINAGEIARAFGGGGHERAAAASLHDHTFEEAIPALWEQITAAIRPTVRVADLMSHGVQTLDADRPLKDVVRQMRRIGHEGFPVVENGQIVGLLTRRDADRAVEHGLGDTRIREVMDAGNIRLKPSDSVSLLEQVMVDSGWGQIPVVDDTENLIGVVTRTDLINHWARTHPTAATPELQKLTIDAIGQVLGEAVAKMIEQVAAYAQSQSVTLYMVGGVVRDLLLKRPNFDVDFVVEGDAISFANNLRQAFGGQVHSFRPFGTAKWVFDESAAKALNLDLHALPDHVDFATARNEFYEHPTALPTVYNSSIKLDLQRRDFTINTLAVQFSPAGATGRIIDIYGGLDDLQNRIIRVLHSLSFVDDPTRILRAIRFEQRLGFTIEARTADLIQIAKPMMRRITGERVRNELTLLMREQNPIRGLIALQNRDLLTAIHPAFQVSEQTASVITEAHQALTSRQLPWNTETFEIIDLYWCIIAGSLPPNDTEALAERLLFSGEVAQASLAVSQLLISPAPLNQPDARPSQIDARLHALPELALLATWFMMEDSVCRDRIRLFWTTWRDIRPTTSGHTLRGRGLRPGPCFSVILNHLRAARLDGEITDDGAETLLLQTLIDQGVCDDRT